MRVKIISPARKAEWGQVFWSFESLTRNKLKKQGALLPPLALPTLAALTPPGVEVALTDENVEPIDFNEEVDLVGISFMTFLAPRAYEIADEMRSRGVKVVLGGIHASMLPQEALQHADSIVIGEAEETWPLVVRDFAAGRLQIIYRASGFPDLQSSPIPRWDLLKCNRYWLHTMQVGRGCPYNCDFCSVTAFNGRKYRYKPLERVAREVETLLEIDRHKTILFADDNLLSIPAYSKELLRLLKPYKVRWWCQASLNRLKEDEILELMRDSGCEAVFVGFESVAQPTLDSMNKGGVNKADEYIEIVRRVNLHSIMVAGSFILGNDADSEGIFQDTVDFVQNARLSLAMINILTPAPGTALFERLEREGRILHKDWWKYNGESICFRPKMDPKALEQGRNQILQEIYSYKVLYQRLREVLAYGGVLNHWPSKRRMFPPMLIALLSKDIDRTWFVLKSLWKGRGASLGPLVIGIYLHEYARRCCTGNRPEEQRANGLAKESTRLKHLHKGLGSESHQ
jgi:radical SAM superfamily enzyme YgiQ (UPF0313 family)